MALNPLFFIKKKPSGRFILKSGMSPAVLSPRSHMRLNQTKDSLQVDKTTNNATFATFLEDATRAANPGFQPVNKGEEHPPWLPDDEEEDNLDNDGRPPGTASKLHKRLALERQLQHFRRVLMYNRLEVDTDELTNLEAEEVDSKFDTANMNFFQYLWALPQTGKPLTSISVPDTILAMQGKVTSWLFTNKAGIIKKRRRSRCEDLNDVYDVITKHFRSDYQGVVALYMRFDRHTPLGAHVTGLTATALREMLHPSGRNLGDGIIQRHVRDHGGNTDLLSATWFRSGHFSLWITDDFVRNSGVRTDIAPRLIEEESEPKALARKQVKRIHKRYARFGKQDMGFAGTMSNMKAHKNDLTRKVQLACESIAHHVESTSPQGYNVLEMRVHFKHDVGGRLWLLWVTDLDVHMNVSMADRDLSRMASGAANLAEARRRQHLEKLNLHDHPGHTEHGDETVGDRFHRKQKYAINGSQDAQNPSYVEGLQEIRTRGKGSVVIRRRVHMPEAPNFVAVPRLDVGRVPKQVAPRRAKTTRDKQATDVSGGFRLPAITARAENVGSRRVGVGEKPWMQDDDGDVSALASTLKNAKRRHGGRRNSLIKTSPR